MNQMKIVLITFFLCLSACVSAQSWLPDTTGTGCQLVKHEGYVLLYDEYHEQARWVAYMLTRERVHGTVPRKGNDRFLPDTTVRSGSALPEDYSGSGYDRGHLAPAADMKWSQRAMRESFLMSNISPQDHAFNEGIWCRAEELVRRWAEEYDTIYVITGPVLEGELQQFRGRGGNVISIPERFFKVVYDPKRKQAIGLLMENRNVKRPLQSFAVSVEEVKRATGIEFLNENDNENEKEKGVCISCWKW